MNKPIDLYIRFDSNGVLNIKVFILLETSDGFIFEKSNDGYYFSIGGRMQLFEPTKDTVSRELFEELQLKDVQVDMVGIIENFFTYKDGAKCHEIGFVYRGTLKEKIDVSSMKPPDNDH